MAHAAQERGKYRSAGNSTGRRSGCCVAELDGHDGCAGDLRKKAGALSESEKQKVSALATLAAGLGSRPTGDGTADAAAAAQAGKVIVVNNLFGAGTEA
ncbi:VENN motif pre-toxin domain-containing protein [Pantoea sp. LMR881]|uniref:VENN motif pre-toxin domain-containing protein n=1 Tax=Pantoea sp. LMR881 TaxID=3014336 RepID=UPI0022AF8119|nr:VENN motif pre-toxin domain-containing protein [Pantoea sp. LMR881]MCZ4058073.1 VENN motif pre-toxin domain-containing protein [Pantoea sp. LMR881]